jgi:hypothetical protein
VNDGRRHVPVYADDGTLRCSECSDIFFDTTSNGLGWFLWSHYGPAAKHRTSVTTGGNG